MNAMFPALETTQICCFVLFHFCHSGSNNMVLIRKTKNNTIMNAKFIALEIKTLVF